MNAQNKLHDVLHSDFFAKRLAEVYGASPKVRDVQTGRLLEAAKGFDRHFPNASQPLFFSAPGRTEICGNHTDHQHGLVLAGSVDLDIIAVVSPNQDNIIRIHSEGFLPDEIDPADGCVHPEEMNRSAALVRGVAARFQELGHRIAGFDAYTISNIHTGIGLSSSAAFEVLIGNIINKLYAGDQESPVSVAQIGQYAENVYYGKPCGLMDQMASSIGGIIAIDFQDPNHPIVEKIDTTFASSGYSLVMIDTGSDHGNITDEYAQIYKEMCAVAAVCGRKVLRDVLPDEVYAQIPEIRRKSGDRAFLRAFHFFAEEIRVQEEKTALQKGDFRTFLSLVIQSGESSDMYLQNIYLSSQPDRQPVAVVLAECRRLLTGKGAWRVHGGGFAGTVQAFVPTCDVPAFVSNMDKSIGEGKCHILSIRPLGGTCLFT
jgi:galactokinase